LPKIEGERFSSSGAGNAVAFFPNFFFDDDDNGDLLAGDEVPTGVFDATESDEAFVVKLLARFVMVSPFRDFSFVTPPAACADAPTRASIEKVEATVPPLPGRPVVPR
jgi:hypothetical protein